MARKLPNSPFIPRPSAEDGPYLSRMVASLTQVFSEIATRCNLLLPGDGTEAMIRPLPLRSFTVAGLLPAADWTGSVVYVSNEAGGSTLAFSDGTNWRRVQDRAVVS